MMLLNEQAQPLHPVTAAAAGTLRGAGPLRGGLLTVRAPTPSVHFTSRSSEWTTPKWLFDALNRVFGFTLDPCSTHENAKCERHFTIDEDGLDQDWGHEVVFMNPPYGREIGLWMQKAFEAAETGACVVCLVPARTDTQWWHEFATRGKIGLFRGRLKFGTAKNSAPFPSALVIFNWLVNGRFEPELQAAPAASGKPGQRCLWNGLNISWVESIPRKAADQEGGVR
jgi:phage N-6-adenine-methyltransferase